MFEIILIIGGLCGFFYLNNRISVLETMLSGRDKTVLPVPPRPVTVDAAVSAPQPSPTMPMVQAVPPSVPPPPTSAGFDEESGGRWLGRLGIAALFIGVAFFLKYAFDTNLIGVVGRIVLGVLTGGIFIAAGQYIRAKYQPYAYLLIGGGVAILYLSFYAAYALYHLVSQPVAFGLMIAVTALTIVLSVVDDSLPLAILALVGGFVTPYFISNGQNDPVSLFAYITILDVAAVVLAVRRKWLALPYLAYVGTILQYLTWYGVYYSQDQLPIAFTFITIFFILFASVPVLLGFIEKGTAHEDVAALVVLNVFGFFSAAYLLLTADYHDTLWILAVLLGMVQYALAYFLYTQNPSDKLLSQVHAGIATVCITIAIPLKLEHSWVALAWLIESLVLFGVAFDFKRASFQMFGGIVFALGVFQLYIEYWRASRYDSTPFFNQYLLLFIVAIGVAYIVAYLYNTSHEWGDAKTNATLAAIFFTIANFLTVYIVTSQISWVYDASQGRLSRDYYYSTRVSGDVANQKNTVISIVWSLYAILLIIIGFAAKLRIARILGLVFFFVTACKIFVDVWSLGEIYRIVASIVFGAIALLGSFLYVRYAQRIKEIIYS